MRRHSLPTGILVFAISLLAGAAIAQAAIATWVSGTGTDAGNCQITAPCRTFAFAHDQTNNNGSINVLSSGNFGPLTITKPISIVADGVEAVMNSAAGGAGIIIQVGAAQIVSLRGLTIDLRGTDNIGISFVSGAALHLHHSVIRRTNRGILFAPASGTSELHIADSVIANSGSIGLLVLPSGSGGATVVLDRVRVENADVHGMVFQGNNTTGSITATVRNSVSAGNSGQGIFAVEAGAGTTTVTIDRSAAVNNGLGLFATGAGATIRIGNSTVSGNTQRGLLVSDSGLIPSYGTNKVDGNGTDGDPTGTIVLK